MFIVGLIGCLVTTSGLAGCIAQYAGTTNKAGNAAGVFFIFLYLAFQGLVFAFSCITIEILILLVLQNMLRHDNVLVCVRNFPYRDQTHWNGIFSLWPICSHYHSFADGSHRYSKCWLEILSGHYLLVYFLHTPCVLLLAGNRPAFFGRD